MTENLEKIKDLSAKLDQAEQEDITRREGEIFNILRCFTDTAIVFDEIGNIKYVNQGCYRLLGYQPDELVDKSMEEITKGDYSKQNETNRIYLRTKDGCYIPCYMNLGSIKQIVPSLFVSVFRKIHKDD